MTPELLCAHGLSADEYARILDIMGREPNLTELGIFSVMWSEHCSYKSSKKWLKTLPTDAPWVIQGPGENAGVIHIGDNQGCVFKMESHNHPSFIEPYNGAATGVGGIMRDVFTMGARPIANLNALRFGDPKHPKTRHLVTGVVAGIGGYGNCMGVPTVAGECQFDGGYNGNILVNAMTVGLVDTRRIFYSGASGVDLPIVYVGAHTGRDGIHGATMASADFDDEVEQKRPTVQVGDPFTEKLLLEACLELMDTDSIVAIQDMGAAGLTSSSFEMASKGGMGVSLNLDKVPQREANMTAMEMMLSESQERMLMILKKGSEDTARAIFEKWELAFAIIGHLTDTGRMVIWHKGDTVADLPIDPLAEAAPEYDRPWTPTPAAPPLDTVIGPLARNAPSVILRALMEHPDIADKQWIFNQYDSTVMANTISGPANVSGGDAALVRVCEKTNKAIAVCSDCTPRYCYADPHQGGRQAVAEAWRNITATGATPLACTDNLNFGNPEIPEIMGQIVGCIQGMGEACKILDFPIVSGNVSLYNQTGAIAIPPTPVIGGVGVIADAAKAVTHQFPAQPDQSLYVIGNTEGHVGMSLYARLSMQETGPLHTLPRTAPPPVDLEQERRHGDFVRTQILSGIICACHDVSDGGLLVAITEMAFGGMMGAVITPPDDLACPLNDWLFGEDQGRYIAVISADDRKAFTDNAAQADVPIHCIGNTGGDTIHIGDNDAVSLETLHRLHKGWLPALMATES